MKKKYILISAVLLIALLVSGGTMAWFTHNGSVSHEYRMGTVQVEVLRSEDEDMTEVEEGTEYKQNIVVKSLGSKKTYVRVRLIPQWSDPNIPIPDVRLEVVDSKWNESNDRYFYYSKYLTPAEDETDPLIVKITFNQLEYEDKTSEFTLKVVAEGVQIADEAWQKVWGIDQLPFNTNQSSNP
ncbi:MAG: hypothetical protein GX160_00075 [Clostridiales bacterium]|nr:hypothetical protein [Clostridiales bacterium]